MTDQTSTSISAHKIGRLTPVGQILLERHLILQHHLDEALTLQKQTGDRVGRILASLGYITTFRLHQAVAEHYQLDFVNLHDTPAANALFDPRDLKHYIRHLAVPFKRIGDDIVLATPDPTPGLIAWAESRYLGKYSFVITSPYDIYWQLDTRFANELDEHSRLNLWKTVPEKSARQVLSKRQKFEFFTLFIMLVVTAVLLPIVLAYTAWALKVMFGRISLADVRSNPDFY